MSVLKEVGGKAATVGGLLRFMWRRRLWWLLPVAFVLLVAGLLIVVGTATGVGPFIYTLF